MRKTDNDNQNTTQKKAKPSPQNDIANPQLAPLASEFGQGTSLTLPKKLSPAQVLRLQRTVGNQAVNRLIQRQRKKTVTHRPSVSFLQRKPHSNTSANWQEEEKPTAPIPVQQPQGTQQTPPQIQRLWQETDVLGEYDWDQDIQTAGHEQEKWHYSEQSGNKLWYDAPSDLASSGRHAQLAGESRARTKAEWRKIGLGKVMKEIDPTTLKNFPLEAEESVPHGPGINLEWLKSNPKRAKKSRPSDGDADFAIKGGALSGGTGKHSKRDQTTSFQSESFKTEEFDWATFTTAPKHRVGQEKGVGSLEKFIDVVDEMGLSELSYLKTIPKEDLGAVTHYTGGEYTEMNDPLRAGGGKNKLNKAAISGLHHLPPVVGKVYRGVKMGIDGARRWGYLNVGGTVSDPGFMSTTIDRRYWHNCEFGGGKVAFEIESKGGAKDVRMISQVSREDEKLFAPHTVFKVQGYTPLSTDITADNKDSIGHTPTVTAAQPVPPSTAAVAIYLEEQPTIQEQTRYEKLGQQWGTVNIDKATAIRNLLRPMWLAMIGDYGISTSELSNVIASYVKHWYRGVLTAVKQIATDPDLADDVIEALGSGTIDSLSGLHGNQMIGTLLARWQTLESATQQLINSIEEERQRELEAERLRLEQEALKQKKASEEIQLFESVVNNDMVMQEINQWYENNSNHKKARQQIVKIMKKYKIPIKLAQMKKFLQHIGRM